MSPATAYRTGQPRQQAFPIGPFVGMQHVTDPTASRPEYARLLRNCYPLDPHSRTRVVGRPGFAQIGAQLGSAGRRTPQLFEQFTKLDGTRYTVAIVGGHFYTLDWSTSTWSETLSAANFSSASITLSQTARCYAVTFADELLVSDGVNKPWTWDGTSNGGLTSLTNAPVVFGPPEVHFGKWFGIKDTERSTFVWSEENQANTGFEAGGFNNAWTLGQTDTDALFRLIASNELLYVFRARSLTAIAGEVTPNFSSTGTREAISSTIGTTAPDSVFFEGSSVLFADADGRPHVLPPGLQPISYWEYFADTLEDLDTSAVDEIEGFYDPTTELSMICFQGVGDTGRSKQLAIHPGGTALARDVSYAAAVFDGYEFGRVGVVENSDGEPRVLHGDASGNVYVHGTVEGSTWDDDGSAIRHEVLTGYIAYSEDVEWHFDRLDYVVVAETNLTELGFKHVTPYGQSTAQEVSEVATRSLWDDALWDVDVWGGDTTISHGAVGLNAFGYYCSVHVTHEVVGERFGLLGMKIRGRPLTSYPAMP